MNCNKNIRTEYVGDIPVDSLESVPDYFLTERDIVDTATGETIRSFTRTPGRKILPNGNLDNVIGLSSGSAEITVPEGQVRAVYVDGIGNMEYADADHAPSMLAVGQVTDLILCQNCGFVYLPDGHDYTIGNQYYVGDDGEPTTTTSDYKLFIPVSRTHLAVNL